jgi:CubicO group peptidase (beta-lactamase class C family)
MPLRRAPSADHLPAQRGHLAQFDPVRRRWLGAAAASALAPLVHAEDGDPWRNAREVWRDGGNYFRGGSDPVASYSGGMERLVPTRLVRAPGQVQPLAPNPRQVTYFSAGEPRGLHDHAARPQVTSLILARGPQIWFEQYNHGLGPASRMTGWSMSKSVTGLLLGLGLQEGWLQSLDDPAEQYVAGLRGTLHGACSLRQLANMTSGAAVRHDADNGRTIYPDGLFAKDADLTQVVRRWNWRSVAPGTRFNYNELCPLTLAWVIRQASGLPLARLVERHLWPAIGAEADATWQTDSNGLEFACVGFAARPRDWLRLGLLVAHDGAVQARQVMDRRWFDELCHWRDDEDAVRFRRATPDAGYKALCWHANGGGTRPMFIGFDGQFVLIDRATKTVLVQTAVGRDAAMTADLFKLFEAATQMSG